MKSFTRLVIIYSRLFYCLITTVSQSLRYKCNNSTREERKWFFEVFFILWFKTAVKYLDDKYFMMKKSYFFTPKSAVSRTINTSVFWLVLICEWVEVGVRSYRWPFSGGCQSSLRGGPVISSRWGRGTGSTAHLIRERTATCCERTHYKCSKRQQLVQGGLGDFWVVARYTYIAVNCSNESTVILHSDHGQNWTL